MAERCQRDNVDLEHSLDLAPVRGLERPRVAEPGVVDEEVQVEATVGEFRAQGLDLLGVG